MVQILLLKDVRKLGHVGDVVDVRPGYARNYLIPYHYATEPTDENIAAIQEEKQVAAERRAQRNREFEQLKERLVDASVTIEASANPEGTLYGSVTARDIASALHEQGFEVHEDHILVDPPIRSLDNRVIPIEFTDDIKTTVKVWVVREGALESEAEGAEADEQGAEVGASESADTADGSGADSTVDAVDGDDA